MDDLSDMEVHVDRKSRARRPLDTQGQWRSAWGTAATAAREK